MLLYKEGILYNIFNLYKGYRRARCTGYEDKIDPCYYCCIEGVLFIILYITLSIFYKILPFYCFSSTILQELCYKTTYYLIPLHW